MSKNRGMGKSRLMSTVLWAIFFFCILAFFFVFLHNYTLYSFILKKWTLDLALSSLVFRFCVSALIFLVCICQIEGHGRTDVARTSAPR